MTLSLNKIKNLRITGSPITTGSLILENNILVTGHENGVVVSWNIENNERHILYTCSSAITTINSSKKNELIIGSQDGHIVLLKLNGDYEVLQTATYNTGHMTCKSQWLNENSFIASSNYGEIFVFLRDAQSKWSKKKVT